MNSLPDPPGPGLSTDSGGMAALDFRNLATFRHVFREKSFNRAALNLGASRRSVVRQVRELEAALGNGFFEKEGGGPDLLPTPVGQRLFHDSAKLQAGMEKLMTVVADLRSQRRVLRVGVGPLLFRSPQVQDLVAKVRTGSEVPSVIRRVGRTTASRELVSGDCDWFFCFEPFNRSRFENSRFGEIPFRRYRRGKAGLGGNFRIIAGGIAPGGKGSPTALDSLAWLRWLDHPAECPEGTVVTAPEVWFDPLFWTDEGEAPEAVPPAPIHAARLRNHPFEFFPRLTSSLRAGISEK